MKTFIFSLLALFLAGCATKITSKDIDLLPQPPEMRKIGISSESFDTSMADKIAPYVEEIISKIVSESNGKIVLGNSGDLNLRLFFRFVPNRSSTAIDFFSLYLPFLSFIPEEENHLYRIVYFLNDKSGNKIQEKTITGTVEGKVIGFSLARLIGRSTIINDQAKYIVKNAPPLILNGLYDFFPKLVAQEKAAEEERKRLAAIEEEKKRLAKIEEEKKRRALEEQRLRAERIEREASHSLTTCNNSSNFDCYWKILEHYPTFSGKQQVFINIGQRIDKYNYTDKQVSKLYKKYPEAVKYFPESEQIKFIGPSGTTVRDIIVMTKAGLTDNLIISKIRASTGPYRNYSFQEIITLKDLGLSEPIIQAMIDKTETRSAAKANEITGSNSQPAKAWTIDSARAFISSNLPSTFHILDWQGNVTTERLSIDVSKRTVIIKNIQGEPNQFSNGLEVYDYELKDVIPETVKFTIGRPGRQLDKIVWFRYVWKGKEQNCWFSLPHDLSNEKGEQMADAFKAWAALIQGKDPSSLSDEYVSLEDWEETSASGWKEIYVRNNGTKTVRIYIQYYDCVNTFPISEGVEAGGWELKPGDSTSFGWVMRSDKDKEAFFRHRFRTEDI